MSSLQDLAVFVYNNIVAKAQRSYAHSFCLSCNLTRHARNSFGLLPQGHCELKKNLNLEKTTSSVQYVLLLIYDCFTQK